MKIAMDLGRSRTRTMVGEKGTTFSSSYKKIGKEVEPREDIENYWDDFVILNCPNKSLIGKRFVKGDAERFYQGISVNADNQQAKVHQEGTFVNIAYALAVNKLRRQEVEIQDDEITLGICIPTAEFFGNAANVMKQALDGTYTLMYPVNKKTISFTLHKDEIRVTPEGVVALLPLANGEQKDVIRNGNILVVDVGHGSTDLTVVKQFKPEGSSSRSCPMGGITLESLVGSSLEKEGLFASPSNIEQAITRGFVFKGREKAPVGALVSSCKRILAVGIVKEMIQTLVGSMMASTEINGIFPIGRCFTDGKEYGTGNLKELLLEEWKHSVHLIEPLDVDNSLELANVIGVAHALQ